MKKRIPGMFMAAVFLFLISCGPDVGTGPVKTPENVNTPTPIVVPTCTPTVSPTPDPAKVPKVTPEPSATPTETVTPMPTATATPEPSATPTVRPTQKPTATPVLTSEPTVSPEPTAEPTPTVTPTPEPTPTPIPIPTMSPTPVPTMDPNLLVYYGWQKTVSILGEYVVIFPDLFRECSVEKTDSELIINYICDENREILFRVSYELQKTSQETLSEILEMGGILLEGTSGDEKVVCQWQENDAIHQVILLETRYPQALLGTAFGEEEWTTGRMMVEFSYPADKCAEYEAMDYNFYVIENREE